MPKATTNPIRVRGMRLELQAMFAVLALLAVTIGAVIALQWLAGLWWLKQELLRESRDISRQFAQTIERAQVGADPSRLDGLVALAFHDPHVAFVAVRDAHGQVISRQIRDANAFAGYADTVAQCDDHLLCETCASFSVRSHDGISGHASAEPIWTADHQLFGVVTIGIVDPAYSAIGAQLVRAGVTAGLIVGVFAVPAVAMVARRLAAPLRRVAAAAEALAAGGRPEPLRSVGPREIASLAHSFNGMAGSLDDASRDLRDANARLESTVRDRTRELRRVNARLELELAERGRFFHAMSHDLGAPLRNIAGSLGLIRKRHGEALPDDALTAFDRIERSIDLELRMIRELLEITRLGAAEERPEVVETLAVALDIRSAFDHDLRTRRIALAVDPKLPVIRAEGARFRQVLQNLVDNAIKYMPDREPRSIAIAAVLNEHGAEFSVLDTGMGIPPREHDRVFEVFRRASNIPQGVAGAGVGLAAVKNIVERWGGTIRVESEPDRGSRFIFTVPAERLVSLPAGTGRPVSENRATAFPG